MFSNFKNSTVVITGHTGFKGVWLAAWLKKCGAKIIGIALDPSTSPSHFKAIKLYEDLIDLRIDICKQDKIEEAIIAAKPDYVFHLAAQALVKNSFDDPVKTWKTNVMGTLYLLEALRKLNKVCSAVIITSDKCYKNKESNIGYYETDVLGGDDSYSASKAAAELVINSYIKSYFLNSNNKVYIASARAGNVIGGGDWSSNRIVPDCMKAWSNNDLVYLRNPYSTRPWQHALEPLSGYLILALLLKKKKNLHGESFNFGPSSVKNYCVLDLVKKMSLFWSKARWKNLLAKETWPQETVQLKLNCDKALNHLGWRTAMNFEDTARMTVDWYQSYYLNPKNIKDMTYKQIEDYIIFAKKKGIKWAQ